MDNASLAHTKLRLLGVVMISAFKVIPKGNLGINKPPALQVWWGKGLYPRKSLAFV